jgi:hypothetical protein
MYLPLAHNGQTFNLVPVDAYFSGRFRVMLDREVDLYDESGDLTDTVEISESLGTVEVDNWNEHVEARTRFNRGGGYFADLSAALAFLVDSGRPCTHPDGNGTGVENQYECTDCGAIYAVTDVLGTVLVRYATERA